MRWTLVLLCCLGSGLGELFSSMADLQSLLTAEKRAIEALNEYIEAEEERLERLAEMAGEPVVEGFQPSHILNPIASFQFIKSWIHAPLWKQMRENEAKDVIEGLEGMPDEGDLEGAAKGLVRLQKTYGIPTKDLAYGYDLSGLGLNGTTLSISDCFELGKVMYRAENYYYALEWLEEAWQKAERADHLDTAGRVEILDYLSWAYQKTGNLQRAYWTAKRSEAMQTDEHTRDNLHYFLEELQENHLPVPKAWGDLPPLTNIPPGKGDEMRHYDDLCVRQPRPPVDARHSCLYKRDSPFLFLAPLREEILNIDPPVSIFRDLLTRREMDHLKALAGPKLRRALVVDRSAGFQERPAEYRVAKNAWMREVGDALLDGVNARIAVATGLSMASAEFLQMANYGIAGQYEPHFDMSTEPETEDHDPYDDDLGNRIATVLIYFNHPQAGGGTVFGDLNLHVEAEEGSAVFWYNLHRNGSADFRMRHAACPVLVGQKWVANKWIRAKGQELLRTCDLDRYV